MDTANKKWAFQVGALTLLSAIVRWPLLDSSLWLDEAAQALESTRPWYQQLDIAADFQPPLFHLIVYVLSQVSWNEAWLRLASLIPGLVSVALLAIIGRRMFSPRVGIVAALMASISSLLVFFSQELRPYMLAVMWGELSLLSYWEWRMNPVIKNKWFFVLGVSLVAGLFSSYVFLFWWMALWLLGWYKSRYFGWRFTILSLTSGVFFLTWWPWFWQQWLVGQDLRAALPGWEQVVSIPQLKALPLLLGKFVVGVMPLDLNILHGGLLGVWYGGTAVLLTITWFRAQRKLNPALGEIFLLLGITLLISWIFSWFTPVLAPKRVLFLLPVLLLGVAALTEKLRAAWFLVILFLCVNILGLGQYWSQPALQRENWKEIIQMVESDFSAQNTLVVFAFDQPFAPWRWYATEDFPTFSSGLTPLTQNDAFRAELIRRSPQYVVVFDYLRDLTDPNDLLLKTLDELQYAPGEVYDQPNIGFVRVYQRATLYAGKNT